MRGIIGLVAIIGIILGSILTTLYRTHIDPDCMATLIECDKLAVKAYEYYKEDLARDKDLYERLCSHSCFRFDPACQKEKE